MIQGLCSRFDGVPFEGTDILTVSCGSQALGRGLRGFSYTVSYCLCAAHESMRRCNGLRMEHLEVPAVSGSCSGKRRNLPAAKTPNLPR